MTRCASNGWSLHRTQGGSPSRRAGRGSGHADDVASPVGVTSLLRVVDVFHHAAEFVTDRNEPTSGRDPEREEDQHPRPRGRSRRPPDRCARPSLVLRHPTSSTSGDSRSRSMTGRETCRVYLTVAHVPLRRVGRSLTGAAMTMSTASTMARFRSRYGSGSRCTHPFPRHASRGPVAMTLTTSRRRSP